MKLKVFQDSLLPDQVITDSLQTFDAGGQVITGISVLQTDNLIYSDSLDSIQQTQTVKVPPSLFTSETIKKSETEPMARMEINNDWMTIHFIICVGLIAWVQVFYRKRLGQILKAFTGARFLNQLEREGNLFKERIAIPLIIVYLISLSSLVYVVATNFLDQTQLNLSGFKLFSFIMSIILILWFLKNVVITILGNVFKNYLLLTDYLLINLVTNIVMGLVLLPLVIVAVYTSSITLVYTGLIFWALVFVFRVIKELFIDLSYTKFSLYPRILYLCTVEFVPLLVLTKLVMSYVT